MTAGRHPLLTVLRATAVIVLLILTLLPVFWIITTSIRPAADVFAGDLRFLPQTISLDHFQSIFASGALAFLLNSVVVAVGSTALALLVAAPASYAMSRFRYPGELAANTRLWVLSIRFVPPFAVAIPIFLLFRDLGLLDTRTGLILAHAVFALPFAWWLLQAGFDELPVEIEDAALVDGCGRLQTLVRIVLPLMGPVVAATAIFIFFVSWNEFLFALLFTSSEAPTMPIFVSRFVTDRSLQFGEIAAAATTASVPAMILLLFTQRYMVRGLTMGAIK